MKELLENSRAHFESNSEVLIDLPEALTEIGKLKSLGGNFQSVLTTLFMPFLNKTLEFNKLFNTCDFEKFCNKFKITTSLLDPLNPLIEADVRFILAGGKMIDFCNNLNGNESVGDFDLFFTSPEEYLLAGVILKREGYEILSDKNHLTEMFHTQNRIKFQLIKTFYSCPEEVIENFDIRACAIAFSDGKVWWIKKTLHDIKNKKLVIQTIKPHKLAWIRPFKYYSKGYTIAPTDLALTSIMYLLSMEDVNPEPGYDPFLYFTDRTYQYVPSPEGNPLYNDFVDNGEVRDDDIPF